MNVDAALKEKRLRNCKRQFSYEAPDDPAADAMKSLEVNFFNIVVDAAVTSLEERFQTLNQVDQKYGVLLNFSKKSCGASADEKILQAKCMDIEKVLTYKGQSDINGQDLASEIRGLPDLPSTKMTALELLTFLYENNLQEIYPNLWVGLRVALTLPVTVSSAERSFSKLKLIKTYLRASMGQERLSGLAILSINREIMKSITYDNIIDDFAMRKSRKKTF
ncbi:unnamed protein product [Knipowitschia caucasica]